MTMAVGNALPGLSGMAGLTGLGPPLGDGTGIPATAAAPDAFASLLAGLAVMPGTDGTLPPAAPDTPPMLAAAQDGKDVQPQADPAKPPPGAPVWALALGQAPVARPASTPPTAAAPGLPAWTHATAPAATRPNAAQPASPAPQARNAPDSAMAVMPGFAGTAPPPGEVLAIAGDGPIADTAAAPPPDLAAPATAMTETQAAAPVLSLAPVCLPTADPVAAAMAVAPFAAVPLMPVPMPSQTPAPGPASPESRAAAGNAVTTRGSPRDATASCALPFTWAPTGTAGTTNVHAGTFPGQVPNATAADPALPASSANPAAQGMPTLSTTTPPAATAPAGPAVTAAVTPAVAEAVRTGNTQNTREARDEAPAAVLPPSLAGLAAAHAAPPMPHALATGPAAALHQAALPSHLLSPAFAGDLTAEVRLMADGGLQQAELRLNPADLGPIRIQLQMNAQTQTADVSFAAAHAVTREGIEQALPALRDMLADQGVSLGHADVSSGQSGGAGYQQAHQQTQDHARMAGLRRDRASSGDEGRLEMDGRNTVNTIRIAPGMLDLYA